MYQTNNIIIFNTVNDNIINTAVRILYGVDSRDQNTKMNCLFTLFLMDEHKYILHTYQHGNTIIILIIINNIC